MSEQKRIHSLQLTEAGNDLLAALFRFQAVLVKSMDVADPAGWRLFEAKPSPLSQHLARLRDLRFAAIETDRLPPFKVVKNGCVAEVLAGLEAVMTSLDPIGSPSNRFVNQDNPSGLREFARSSNGDTWLLGRDTTTGARFVTHRANAGSGGHETSSSIDEFLSIEPLSPERVSLVALLADEQT